MIPVHVVTGFLGAGKTSFLNRLLADPELKDTLVVVNEFGEAARDHLLYERLEGEMLLLASGCLCCTLRGDFVDGLLDILVKRDANAFRRIVVETSGLADPGPMLHALFADDHLAARVRLAEVTTLVDAVNGADTLERHGEARRQVALADRIALSKTDLASGEPLRARLRQLAPAAEIVDARTLGAAEFLAEFSKVPATYSPRAAHGAAQAHVFRSASPLAPAAFARFLELLRELAGPKLLRVKGLVATADAPERPWLVQGAQHLFAPPLRLERWPGDARETTLVVIGEDVGEATRRLWDALTGVPSPDAPDWAALTENPLAPRAGGWLV